jgi:hypothetical protein
MLCWMVLLLLLLQLLWAVCTLEYTAPAAAIAAVPTDFPVAVKDAAQVQGFVVDAVTCPGGCGRAVLQEARTVQGCQANRRQRLLA